MEITMLIGLALAGMFCAFMFGYCLGRANWHHGVADLVREFGEREEAAMYRVNYPEEPKES